MPDPLIEQIAARIKAKEDAIALQKTLNSLTRDVAETKEIVWILSWVLPPMMVCAMVAGAVAMLIR